MKAIEFLQKVFVQRTLLHLLLAVQCIIATLKRLRNTLGNSFILRMVPHPLPVLQPIFVSHPK
jgi:hypothetical protein